MKEKICFSKRIGVLAVFSFIVVTGVILISISVTTNSVMTQSRASVNCTPFSCSVYGGSSYSGNAYVKKINNTYLYYTNTNTTCSGAGSKGGWKSVCTKGEDTTLSKTTRTQEEFFKQYDVKLCGGVLTGRHIYKNLGSDPNNLLLTVWGKECAKEYGSSNTTQCYASGLGIGAGEGYDQGVGYYSSMQCEDSVSGTKPFCCPKPCYAVDTQDPGYVTDGFGSLVGMFPTRVICVMK